MADPVTTPPPAPAPAPMSIRHAVPRVAEAVRSQPWAITEDYLRTITAIADRENEISVEALEALQAKRVQGTFDLRVREGVAILAVAGPLMRYADMFSMISGATSYEALRRDLQTAVNDPAVRAILLTFDSPGGTTNGCAEMAQAVADAGKVKPVEAYIGGEACSAAYWIATACNRMTMDRTAVVGSIGVVMNIRDTSERDAKSGVTTREFVSSRAPNKRVDYGTDEGRAKALRLIDALEGVFIDSVAANRGVSADDVATKFGGGGLEVGADAVRIGMADAVGSFEDVFARLRAGNGQKARNKGKSPMTDITQAAHDAAVAAALERGRQEAAATAAATTAAAEEAASKRIAAILDSEDGKKRPTQARHLAFNTKLSAEDAAGILANSAVEATTAAAPQAPATGAAAQPNRTVDAAAGLVMDAVQPAPDTQAKPKPSINAASIYDKLNKRTA